MARTRKITASFIPPGLAMEETILNSKNGPIWHHRPSVTSTGLLSIIWNRKHRPGATTPPLFRDVAFAPTGLSLAAVDARGHLTHFNFILNRYYHVKHTGSPGIRIVWHPLKKDEVIVSSEDGLVSGHRLTTSSFEIFLQFQKCGLRSLNFPYVHVLSKFAVNTPRRCGRTASPLVRCNVRCLVISAACTR